MKIAFVDPLASPLYLAKELKDKGFEVICVYTLKDFSPEEKKLRFHPEAFDHTIILENETLEELADYLRSIDVARVFAGYEASVEYVDQLAELVCPRFANHPRTSILRCNKYAMQEALRQHRLPAIKQLYVQDKKLTADDIVALKGFGFPLIVKPINGAASIGLKKCFSIDELQIYLQNADYRQMHAHSEQIADYVIQECLEGDEYLVDTFSIAGEHSLAGIQRYCKTYFDGMPIYRYAESIDPASEEWGICYKFVQSVLTAVGLNNGFAHTEMFITTEGPRLVEVNPRISGAHGFHNKLHTYAYREDQTTVMAKQLQGDSYSSCTSGKGGNKPGRVIMLQNWHPKKIRALQCDMLMPLPSYQEHLFLKQEGDFVGIPKILSDSIAFVLLAHESLEQLNQDYAQLMEWEEKGLLF